MTEEHKPQHLRPVTGIRASLTFLHYVYRSIKFVGPIFWSLLMLMVIIGQVIGLREGWTIGDSFYFTFITGFTIGYGDITPKYPLTKVLAIFLAGVGFLFTGILVAIAVESLRYTITGKSPLDKLKE
jgi:hypothetical protein